MCCWCLPGKILRRNRGVQIVHVLGLCLNKKLPNARYFNLLILVLFVDIYMS
jgi:hypothetical protein